MAGWEALILLLATLRGPPGRHNFKLENEVVHTTRVLTLILGFIVSGPHDLQMDYNSAKFKILRLSGPHGKTLSRNPDGSQYPESLAHLCSIFAVKSKVQDIAPSFPIQVHYGSAKGLLFLIQLNWYTALDVTKDLNRVPILLDITSTFFSSSLGDS